MNSKDIFKNLQQAVDFMDRHPVAIAIAMTPAFKSQLGATQNPLLSLGCMQQMNAAQYAGLRAYVWKNLPEPYRVYFNQAILDRDIALYNS